ncbi:MAG: hypothetical protein H6704_01320 [Myxococcales bacterium]|nr:hypothetical protein [Myxococcales bacterium]
MLALLTVLLLAAPPAPTAEAPLDVEADRLVLDQKTGEVVFEGNVRAQQEELTLTCRRLVARYRDDGQVASLLAEGAVRVESGELGATAGRAAWSAADGTLELTGEPVVTRGADRLTGRRIVFWPEQGRVVVEAARGRLRAPRVAADLERALPRP